MWILVQASWQQLLQESMQSIRQRSKVYNWGGFTPKEVMDRLSKGAKQTQKPTFVNGKGPKPDPPGTGGSGQGGSGGSGGSGGQGPSWADAGQAALLIAALMAYNSFSSSPTGSGGRMETIDFQTFRNNVLAKDIVDKVRNCLQSDFPRMVLCRSQHCCRGAFAKAPCTGKLVQDFEKINSATMCMPHYHAIEMCLQRFAVVPCMYLLPCMLKDAASQPSLSSSPVYVRP
jgi:hypothetical protein